jgi:hypothetical protein
MNNCRNITLTRKTGEYSIGFDYKGSFAVRYSEIKGGNKLLIVHSGNYYFARFGGKNEEEKARTLWSEDFLRDVKRMLKEPPVLSGVEISNGEYLLAHLKKDDISKPSNIALIGLLSKKEKLYVCVDVWGDAYKFILPNELDLSNPKDAEIKRIIDERIKSAGLESVLKV